MYLYKPLLRGRKEDAQGTHWGIWKLILNYQTRKNLQDNNKMRRAGKQKKRLKGGGHRKRFRNEGGGGAAASGKGATGGSSCTSAAPLYSPCVTRFRSCRGQRRRCKLQSSCHKVSAVLSACSQRATNVFLGSFLLALSCAFELYDSTGFLLFYFMYSIPRQFDLRCSLRGIFL